MSNPYPRETASQALGKLGRTVFELIVRTHLRCEYRPTPQESDFGIDGYVDLVTPDGYVTGRSIAVQLKAGPSQFAESNDSGWIYRGEMKHLNYYANHAQPVALVIVDTDRQEAWWAKFELEATRGTGAGWAITVPRSQRLTAAGAASFTSLASKAVDYLPYLEHLWAENEELSRAVFIGVVISREEIEHTFTHPFEALIERLMSSREVILSSQGKVDFFIVGYDDDPRELYSIPEVRRWIIQAITNIRYVAWFFDMGHRAQGMVITPPCFCEYERNGEILSLKLGDLLEFVQTHFHNLNELAERYSLPDSAVEASSRALLLKLGLDAPPT